MNTSTLVANHAAGRRWAVLVSPLMITLIGALAGRGFGALLGQWAWVGVALVYWGSLVLTIALLGEKGALARWYGAVQGRRWLWLVVALVIGVIPLPMLFFPHLQLLNSVGLILVWLVFGALNANFEEAYWRGFLLDHTQGIPRPVTVIASNLIFTALHPLMWGAFSRPMMVHTFWGIVFIMGVVYSLMYLSTRSLRLPVLSHFLVDLGNMSIFVFMNLIVVPGL